jgi:hypothetical protein
MLLRNRILDIFVFRGGFINPIWLSSFRIYGSLIFLFHFLSLIPDFHTFWGPNAIVNPDIIDANIDDLIPTIFDIHQLINKHLSISFQTLATTLAIFYCLALFFLALGLWTRLSAAAALLTHLILVQSINIFVYGVDYITTICLFYLLIFPVGKIFSLDVFFKKVLLPDVFEIRFFLKLFQIHWCLAYFFSGLSKALGPTWWNGEAIWKALISYNQTGFFVAELWAPKSFLMAFIGITTIFLELLFPIGMIIKVLRKPWIIAIVLMHIFIGFLLGLYFFSMVMILINLVGFWFPYFPKDAGNDFIPKLKGQNS